MTQDQFDGLTRGDIVRHIGTGDSFVIERGNSRNSYTAVRTIDISNPQEWIVYRREPPKPREWWVQINRDHPPVMNVILNDVPEPIRSEKVIKVREVLE